MDCDQNEFDRRRLRKYYHCDSKLRNRYGIKLNPHIWITLNNMYWNRQYECIVMKNNDPDPLIIFEKYGAKLFGVFDTTFLVFSTFLDPKAGAFGRCAWRNNKVYRL